MKIVIYESRLDVKFTHAKLWFGLYMLATTLVTLSLFSTKALAIPNFQMPFPCSESWTASTYSGHNAIDWNLMGTNDSGRTVVASIGGTATADYSVDESGFGYGNYVMITHDDDWQTRYAHLIDEGASGDIAQGQVLGEVGSTGADAPHLHWEQIHDGTKQSTLYADGLALTSGTTYTSSDPSHTSNNTCGGSGLFLNDIYSTSGSNIRVSLNGGNSWTNRKATGGDISTMLMGDFDEDGEVDDVFQATGSLWQYSVDGQYSWNFLRNSGYIASNLRVGDADADGFVDDIYSTSGTYIVVSIDGSGSWGNRKATGGNINSMLLGDFDQDGEVDDVFQATGSLWQYSINGSGSWNFLRNSSAQIAGLKLGDADSDGYIDDIYGTTGSYIVVSINGSGSWGNRKATGGSMADMIIGDFDEDSDSDDVLQATGSLWQYSVDGQYSWNFLRNSGVTVPNMRVGETL